MSVYIHLLEREIYRDEDMNNIAKMTCANLIAAELFRAFDIHKHCIRPISAAAH